MAQKTLNISAENFDYGSAQLFIEIASKQFSFFVLDKNNCFNAFCIYTVENVILKSKEEIKTIFNEALFSKQYKKVTIFFATPESIISPAAFFDSNHINEVIELMYGPDFSGINKTDFLVRQNAYNTYRIPGFLNKLINEKFPDNFQYHQFSILSKIDHGDGTNISCIFYNNGFTVQVKKGNNIVFNNYFNFVVPADVLYHLLSVCESFDIDISATNVIVAGLIEKKSALYNELYKYFLNISFFDFSGNYSVADGFTNYPKHFFNHLFAMAVCV